MSFKNILKEFMDPDRPEVIRTFEEILNENKIINKYEFDVFYRGLDWKQKYNLCKIGLWKLMKEGKSLKEIFRLLGE